MRIVGLPTPIPFFTLRTSLAGQDFFIRFEWNQRYGWMLGLKDSQQQTIFDPRALVVRQNLLDFTVDDRAPSGALILYDTTGRAEDPGFSDLGTRHLLGYLTQEEVDNG